MNFQQIEHFLTLARTLNFTDSARINKIAQPSFTKSIKRLEEDIGGTLFHRDGKNTRLTELGRSVHASFERIAQNKQKLEDIASNVTTGLQNSLNIGVHMSVGAPRFVEFFVAFSNRYPNSKLIFHDVHSKQVTDLLLSGELDCCLCSGDKSDHPKLQFQTLFEDRLELVCSLNHPFTLQESVTYEQIAKARYIDRVNCEYRDLVQAAFRQREQTIMPVIISNRDDWLQSLVASDMGVSIIPRSLLMHAGVTTRPIEGAGRCCSVALASIYSGAISESANALRRYARNYNWMATDDY